MVVVPVLYINVYSTCVLYRRICFLYKCIHMLIYVFAHKFDPLMFALSRHLCA